MDKYSNKQQEVAKQKQPVVETPKVKDVNILGGEPVTVGVVDDVSGDEVGSVVGVVDDVSGDEVVGGEPVILDDVSEDKKGDSDSEKGNEVGSVVDGEPVILDDGKKGDEETGPGDNVLDGGEPEVEVDIDVYTANKVKMLLEDAKIDMVKKLEIVAKQGVPELRMVASKLVSYAEQMSSKSPFTSGADCASKNYDLLNTLKSVVETVDYNLFKIKFDLVNTAFLVYAKDAYQDVMLHRFDREWNWGEESLTTFQYLTTLIGILANLSTRETESKKIDINKALNPDEITLSANAIENIKKYYN